MPERVDVLPFVEALVLYAVVREAMTVDFDGKTRAKDIPPFIM